MRSLVAGAAACGVIACNSLTGIDDYAIGRDGAAVPDVSSDGASSDVTADGSSSDAPTADSACAAPKMFTCFSGNKQDDTSCNAATQYCVSRNASAACASLPPACACPQNTCACLLANIQNPCSGTPTCTQSGDEITISC